MDAAIIARPISVPRFGFNWSAACCLLAGVAWLAPSVHDAVTQGGDADILRLWRVGQFIQAGVNPYPLGRAALESAYGPSEGGRLSRADVQVHAIPRSEQHRAAAIASNPSAAELVELHGVPEATYPPPANLLLALTLGLLPESNLVAVWTGFNLLLLAGIVALLSVVRTPLLTGVPTALVAGLLLLWSPTHDVIRATQFSLLVLACLLAAYRLRDTHEILAGLLFTIALIKPSVTIPFLFLPFVRGRWRTLAVVVAMQFAGMIGMSYWCACAPWKLPGQWLGVAGYFTQGTCSLQELINRLHLDNTPAGLALTLGFLLAVLAWCWRCRHSTDDALFDYLCFASVLWTYHRPYDLVVLFLPLVRRFLTTSDVTQRAAGFTPAARQLAASSFVILTLALGSGFMGVWYHPVFRVLRWAARLILMGWFVGLAWSLRGEGGLAAPRSCTPAQWDVEATRV